MDREQLVLAAMSRSGTDLLSPVQVQKMFFLIDRNIANQIGGKKFDFQPYHYGPFDPDVYRSIESLEGRDLARINRRAGSSARHYSLTKDGIDRGEELYAELPKEAQDYIDRAVDFVQEHGFSQLVSAIYRAYPEMEVNSIFTPVEPSQ